MYTFPVRILPLFSKVADNGKNVPRATGTTFKPVGIASGH